MNTVFQFNEAANSPDLTDDEVASAISTSRAEDLPPHLKSQACACGEILEVRSHEKRFRFPHFYWRVSLVCGSGHVAQKVFQATWLYRSPTPQE